MDPPARQVPCLGDGHIVPLGLFHQGLVCHRPGRVAKQGSQIIKIESRDLEILAIQGGMAGMQVQLEGSLFQKTGRVGRGQRSQGTGGSHLIAFDLLQLCQEGLDLRNDLLLAGRLLAFGEDLRNPCDDHDRLDRLDEIIARAQADGLDGRLQVRMCRQDQNGHVGELFVDLNQQLDAAHPGQVQIQEHEIVLIPLQKAQRLFCVDGRFHAVLLLLQDQRQAQPEVMIIVHDQDGIVRSHGVPASFPAGASGSHTVKVTPFPGALSTQISP